MNLKNFVWSGLFSLIRLSLIALCIQEIVFFVVVENIYGVLALILPVLIIIFDSVYIIGWKHCEEFSPW